MNRQKVMSQKRAWSAHHSGEKRQLPLSSKIERKRMNRTHTQSQQPQAIQQKTRSRLYTTPTQHVLKPSPIQTKPPQQILQQNFHLRNQLNSLNSKLYLTRTKIQSQKKKHLIYAKKLNREFQKELYWPKQNDYLITGVKHQYERLKQDFEEKCRELEGVRLTVGSTQVGELQAYCEALETENKILLENLTYLKKTKKRNNSSIVDELSNSFSKLTSSEIQQLLAQQQKRTQFYKRKATLLQQQLKRFQQSNLQLQKKLNFLQKLIIEKQNEAYHSHKKTKTLEKEKLKLINEIKLLEGRIKDDEGRKEVDLKEIKESNDRQAKVEKAMFERTIREKNVVIEKLEKEIGYLTTLLSYWKPLDELDRMDKGDLTSSQLNKTSSQLNKTLQNNSLSFPTTHNRQLLNRSRTPVSFMQQHDDIKLTKTLKHDELSQLNKQSSLHSINDEDELKLQSSGLLHTTQNREIHRSTKKWSQDCKKNRKVSITQIDYVGELIKYKMIAEGLAMNDVKEFFAFKGKGAKIDEEFITMKQIKDIFVQQPFSLIETQAYFLARYIVEDEGVQFVYTHDQNQLERSIVKSIIKTIIGDYTLPNITECQQKWQQIKKVYSHNMQLALKSICPKGTISKDKFFELINSLGIQMDDQTKNYLVGRLIQGEISLRQLKYDRIFDNDERIG